MLSPRQLANAIRALAMDAVQKARSGHPGMPMGMADIAEVLWRKVMHFNPRNPEWPNRDRFVLSNGHGAMLLYAVLHLTGFALSMEDIKQFRQLHSRTPGHPEYRDTPGVEATTGPLAQGLAMAVGMALAERQLAADFNREGYAIVDHHTYVFVGDGCLMEGLSHEACSLAGRLGLGKLIVFYDDNGVSIDGDVTAWFTDNTPQRFMAYGWQVLPDVDGHDSAAVADAIAAARADTARPTLICCKTHIAYGSPNKVGTAAAHGAPLGEEEVAQTRLALQWPHDPFVIPPEYYQAWNQCERGHALEDDWNRLFAAYQAEYPELAMEFLRRQKGRLPERWPEQTARFIQDSNEKAASVATRWASRQSLDAYAPLLPELLGGSADLTDSNCTAWSGAKSITDLLPGNYIHYGVREFAMAAIANGLALHRGVLPYVGTFLVFSDYARNAIRLSALMRLHVVYVLTHDSIGLGEDGPTHQPIEHAASLRLMPGMTVWRPCDVTETAVAWQQAIATPGPHALLLTRQNVAHAQRTQAAVFHIARGGYVLLDPTDVPLDGILIATGSEVALAVEAARSFWEEGVAIRVVSMPSCEVFKMQTPDYRESVLPSYVKARVAVEAGVPDGWRAWVGDEGAVVGIERYGHSAPAAAVFSELGMTVERVKDSMMSVLKRATHTHTKAVSQ